MKSARYKPTALALCQLVLLGSCVSLPSRRASWIVDAPPALTAWVLAETLRSEFPSADPEPWQNGALVSQLSENRYVLDYRSSFGHIIRGTTNGRLTAPDLFLRLDHAEFSAPNFQPAHSHSVAPSGTEWVILQITHAPDSTVREPRSKVEIDLRGNPALLRIEAHIERALKLISRSCRTARLVQARAWTSLAEELQGAFTSESASCCASHLILSAPLHVHRASLFKRQGRLQEARIALDRALELAPESASLRARVAELDNHLAWPNQARDHWVRLAHDLRFGAMGYAIAARIRPELARHSDNTEGFSSRARSLERLAVGDISGALAWARRARACASNTIKDLELAILIHRRQGDHATAVALGFAQLAEQGMTSKNVLSLSQDCLALGEPTVALRLLGRHWTELQQHAPYASRIALERAQSQISGDLDLRILATEHAEALSLELLAARNTGPQSEAGLALLQRLTRLRETTTTEAPQPRFRARARPDYESAPGISPPR